MPVTDAFRRRIGDAVFERVVGPRQPVPSERPRITEAERWFAADRPIRLVHDDCAMFAGSIAALLMQSLHPLAMAAVADHSGYRDDPWGRLQRTSRFVAVTTFGRRADALAAIAKVRAIHEHVTGTAPDGRPYAASDPHLLTWVHVAEIYAFLRAYEVYGGQSLDQAARDGYVADMALIAAELGVPDPPRTEAGVTATIGRYRPELAGTPQAWAAARFLLREPPLPLVVRPLYRGLAEAAVALLPRWARSELRIPALPFADAVLARPAGHLVVNAIRWGISAPNA
ncbi:oxygenase MpaB family protein [Trebonia sp.]|uniref:oxygenase MpaB family protein n=1 Tax=Trebonia sp. TaxID=2767075 RepID=UPI00262D529B|nr:oxygenase MpaB family protein [Trebonia sp.]